jgi:hypothetical protein
MPGSGSQADSVTAKAGVHDVGRSEVKRLQEPGISISTQHLVLELADTTIQTHAHCTLITPCPYQWKTNVHCAYDHQHFVKHPQ